MDAEVVSHFHFYMIVQDVEAVLRELPLDS